MYTHILSYTHMRRKRSTEIQTRGKEKDDDWGAVSSVGFYTLHTFTYIPGRYAE